MKNRYFQCIVLFLLFMAFGVNLNATTKEIEDYETPKMEQFEREIIDETTPKKMTRSSGGLSIPTEGVYDTVKDTKNSSGVLTERRYYYKSKLVEKRTYTSTASSDCRMRNKYLYFSDGKTVERHRTYSNTKDVCYNLQTKVYTDQSKLKSHTFYEGKVNGQITEIRTYDISGKYYIGKSFYKKGIVYKKEYWLGKSSNRITHIANFNSAGTNWTDATYYDTDGDKTSYVKYTGTEPNKKVYTLYYDKQTQEKTTSIYYDETGKYVDYKSKWKNGIKTERTYYSKDENEIKLRTVYYDENGNIEVEEFYEKDGSTLEKVDFFVEKGDINDISIYFEDGEITSLEKYSIDKVNLVKWKTFYKNEKREYVDYYNNDGKKIREHTFTEKDTILENKIKEINSNNLGNGDLDEDYDDIITFDSKEDFDKYVKENNLQDELEEVEMETISESKFEKYGIFVFKLDGIVNNSDLYEYIEKSLDGTSEQILIEDLLEIQEISLHTNLLNNSIDFNEICLFENLEKIELNGFEIEGLSDEIINLAELRELIIVNANLAEVNSSLNSLSKLETINLSNNNIEDISNILFNQDSLKSVKINNNNLSVLTNSLFDLHKNGINVSLDNNLFIKTNIDLNNLNNEEFTKFIGKQKTNINDIHYIDKFTKDETTIMDIINEDLFNEDDKFNLDILNNSEITISQISIKDIEKLLEDEYISDYDELLEFLTNKNIDLSSMIANSEKVSINLNELEKMNLNEKLTQTGIYIININLNEKINNNIYSSLIIYSETSMIAEMSSELTTCEKSPYGEIIEGENLKAGDLEVKNFCQFKNNEAAYNDFMNQNSQYINKIDKHGNIKDIESLLLNYQTLYSEYISNYKTEDIKELEEIEKQHQITNTFIDILENKYENEKIDDAITSLNNSMMKRSADNYNATLEDLYLLLPDIEENEDIYNEYSENSSENKIMTRSVKKYDIKNAIKYAKKNAFKWKGGYEIKKGGDCTNFVSRVLNGGGKVAKDYNASKKKGWWLKKVCYTSPNGEHRCFNNYIRSNSWANANSFGKYWIAKASKTKTFSSKTKWSSLKKYAIKGDVLLADWTNDGSWDHAGYVVDKSKKNNLAIAQHSNNYWGWATKKGKAKGWVTEKNKKNKAAKMISIRVK